MHTKQELVLRPFEPSDIDQVIEITAATWYSDRTDPNVRYEEAACDVAHYLSQSTWSCVAVSGHELLGFLFAKEPGRKTQPAFLAALSHKGIEPSAAHSACHDTCHLPPLLQKYVELEEDYCKASLHETYVSLTLFAIRAAARGMGLGRRLLGRAHEEFKQRHDAYYLMTDDSCNVGFYQHLGLQEAMSRSFSSQELFGEAPDRVFSLYVYEGKIS